MLITHSWVISSLECFPEHNGEQDVVSVVHWRRQATDGTHMADVYGAQDITLDAAAPFTPYNQLTQDQVKGWLVDAMGVDRVAELDTILDKQIADKVDPLVVIPPLPWA